MRGNAAADHGTAEDWDEGDHREELDVEIEGSAGEADGDEQDDDDQPTAAQLREDWVQACGTVQTLERSRTASQYVLDAARAHRDERHRIWKEARQPHPLHMRLRWAENELNDALAKQEAHREEMQQFITETDRRKAQLEERATADAARVEKKRDKLDSIRAEGGSPIGVTHAAGYTDDRGARRIAISGIETSVALPLSTVIERMEEGPERHELQGILSSLTQVHGVLTKSVVEDAVPTPYYRIGGSDESDAEGDGTDGQGGINGPREPRQGGADGSKRAKVEAPTTGARGSAASMPEKGSGPAGASIPRWTKSKVTAPAWGKHAWARKAWADETEGTVIDGIGSQGSHTAAAAASAAATATAARPTPKERLSSAEAAEKAKSLLHHQGQSQQRLQEAQQQQEDAQAAVAKAQAELQQQRDATIQQQQQLAQQAQAQREMEEQQQRMLLWAAMSDEERKKAEELHAQQAAVGASKFGSQQAGAMAGQVHQARVQEVLEQAKANGVQADPAALLDMSPEKLEEYAKSQQGWQLGFCDALL